MINIFGRLKSAVIFLIVFFPLTILAVDFPPVPTPFRYVNDYTDTLSTTEQNLLESKLIQFSQQTSSQMAVVIVPTTAEYEISQYTFELGDKWGVGRKQHNNGILMLIAKNDRKIFIAVGQGLEGVLPDAVLSQIIRNTITPAFKQNQYAQGIDAGVEHIIAMSKGEFSPQQLEEEELELEDYIVLSLLVLFVFLIFSAEMRWRKQPYISPTNKHRTEQILRRSISNRRSSGGGFSGFGGGSSGGGFGGGSFGGGGAGGSW